jgi:hypothetical protein
MINTMGMDQFWGEAALLFSSLSRWEKNITGCTSNTPDVAGEEVRSANPSFAPPFVGSCIYG